MGELKAGVIAPEAVSLLGSGGKSLIVKIGGFWAVLGCVEVVEGTEVPCCFRYGGIRGVLSL